jgi:hypothetical protein
VASRRRVAATMAKNWCLVGLVFTPTRRRGARVTRFEGDRKRDEYRILERAVWCEGPSDGRDRCLERLRATDGLLSQSQRQSESPTAAGPTTARTVTMPRGDTRYRVGQDAPSAARCRATCGRDDPPHLAHRQHLGLAIRPIRTGPRRESAAMLAMSGLASRLFGRQNGCARSAAAAPRSESRAAGCR